VATFRGHPEPAEGRVAARVSLFGGVLLTYDFLTEQRDLVNNSTTLANVIADNIAAAVAFNDPDAAVDTLTSLRADVEMVDTSADVLTDTELAKLLVTHAREGRRVVRLYVGDPFLGCSGAALVVVGGAE